MFTVDLSRLPDTPNHPLLSLNMLKNRELRIRQVGVA
jgi:hypothetical protein